MRALEGRIGRGGILRVARETQRGEADAVENKDKFKVKWGSRLGREKNTKEKTQKQKKQKKERKKKKKKKSWSQDLLREGER